MGVAREAALRARCLDLEGHIKRADKRQRRLMLRAEELRCGGTTTPAAGVTGRQTDRLMDDGRGCIHVWCVCVVLWHPGGVLEAAARPTLGTRRREEEARRAAPAPPTTRRELAPAAAALAAVEVVVVQAAAHIAAGRRAALPAPSGPTRWRRSCRGSRSRWASRQAGRQVLVRPCA